MILFGYKTNHGSILRALCAIGVGAVMICMPNRGTELLVKIIGALIFAAGLVSLTISFINRKQMKPRQFTFSEINACLIAIIGGLLIFFPEMLTKAIIIVVGLALVFFGGLQMLVLGGAANLLGLGYVSLCYGALAIVGGIVILFNPFTEVVMSIVAGSLLVYYGLSELLSLKKVSSARKEYEIRYAKPEPESNNNGTVAKKSSIADFSSVKDADYVEVDDQ
ncbi:MAG: DUF308 domain-containing protein [Bacteroidales bacterium]|nr:DUF308 domain-containing protein [Bacteroidales bacterium]